MGKNRWFACAKTVTDNFGVVWNWRNIQKNFKNHKHNLLKAVLWNFAPTKDSCFVVVCCWRAIILISFSAAADAVRVVSGASDCSCCWWEKLGQFLLPSSPSIHSDFISSFYAVLLSEMQYSLMLLLCAPLKILKWSTVLCCLSHSSKVSRCPSNCGLWMWQ